MNSKYLFLGDSLIAGYGVNKNKSWVSKLSNNILLYNAGVNGNSTVDILYRISDEISKSNPTHIFLMGGTNDLLLNRSLTHIIDNITVLIDECKKKNLEILIGIPPYIISDMAKKLFMPSMNYDYAKDKLVLLRDELIKLCNSSEIPYVDFYTLTKDNIVNDIYIDGIHLNEKGHEMMFDFFVKEQL